MLKPTEGYFQIQDNSNAMADCTTVESLVWNGLHHSPLKQGQILCIPWQLIFCL